MSKELKNSLHTVNAALIKCLNAANTWHQIEQAAQAALHCHLHYELMLNAEIRDMQENSTTGVGQWNYTKNASARAEVSQLLEKK